METLSDLPLVREAVPFNSPEIFKINFLRRQFLPRGVRRLLAALAFVYVGLQAVVTILLLVSSLTASLASRSREAALQKNPAGNKQALESEMQNLQAEVTGRLQKMNAFIALRQEAFPAVEKLAGIARTLPARTWIADLTARRKERTLRLNAVYLVNPDKPYTLPVTSWIEALKADPDFGRGLARIRMVNSSQRRQSKTDLYSFELSAEWKASAQQRGAFE